MSFRQPVGLQPRSSSDGYNDLFFGPGGQMIDIDQQSDAHSGDGAQVTYQSADFVGQSTQTLAFDVQPSSEGLVVPPATSSNIISLWSFVPATTLQTAPSPTTFPTAPSSLPSGLLQSSSLATSAGLFTSGSVRSASSSYSLSSFSLLPSSSSSLAATTSTVQSLSSSTVLSVLSVSSTGYLTQFVSLSGSSTLMSTSQSSSSSSSSTSSSTAASATGTAVNAAALTTRHPATFYLGIVLGSIVGFAILAAFVAWCVRMCKHREEGDIENSEPWPWSKESHDQHLESGLHDLHGLDEGRWPVRAMLGEKPPSQEPQIVDYGRRDAFGIQYPTGAIGTDVLRGTPKNPVFRVGGPLHPALQGTPRSILTTPFVPVPNGHQSVPDLAPDIGRLQVTNHMPGDVSSGDEGSRANSRQGPAAIRSQVTPMQATPMQVYNRDNGTMMNVPLTPMQPKIVDRPPHTEPPLPFPGQTQRKGSEASQRSTGWAASIRSNIANTFNAIVGAQPSASSAEDLLPHKQADASLSDSYGPSSPGKLAYDGLEVPVVCLNPVDDSSHDWDDLSAWMTNQKFTPAPPQVAQTWPTDLPSHVPAALMKKTPRPFTESPAQLRAAPPMSRTTTSESARSAEESRRDLEAIRRSRRVKRSAITRPVLTGRTSTRSTGSELSRMSSASPGPLTEQEKFARRALKERRLRVLGMQGGGNPRPLSTFQSRIPRGTMSEKI